MSKNYTEQKRLAKSMVVHCFRNTHLENIHAGEKNGGVGAGFKNKEMKKLMIEAVDNVYTFLLALENKDYRFKGKMLEYMTMYEVSTKDWNEPKIVKDLIIQNNKII